MRKTFTITMMLVGAVAIHGALTACGGPESSAHAGGAGGGSTPSVYMGPCDMQTRVAVIKTPGYTADQLLIHAHPYGTPSGYGKFGTSIDSLPYFGTGDGLIVVDCANTNYTIITVLIDP